METYAAVIARLEKTPNQSKPLQEALECCKSLLNEYKRSLAHNHELKEAAKGLYQLAFDPTK